MAYTLRMRGEVVELSSDSSDDYSNSDSDPTFMINTRPQRTRYDSDPDYQVPRPRRRLQPRTYQSLLSPIPRKIEMRTRAGIGSSRDRSMSSGTNDPRRQTRGRPRRARNYDGGEQLELLNTLVPRRSRGQRRRPPPSAWSSNIDERRSRAKQRTVLEWLIDSNMMVENERVCYLDIIGGRWIALNGIATKGGILCSCCDRVVTVVEFEYHGRVRFGIPNKNIEMPYGKVYTASLRASLLYCQTRAWTREQIRTRCGFNNIRPQDGVEDKHDDACIVCADGGDLICCESCPSTFHKSCIDLPMVPIGEWYCPYCYCKFCKESSSPHLMTCSLCLKKFCAHHPTCIKADRNFPYPHPSFCTLTCRQLYKSLEDLVGITNELGEGLTWTLLRRMNILDSHTFKEVYFNTMCNSKLAVASSVIEECFMPIIDRQTNVNIIKSVVYNCGSNYARVNFTGFYTAILEKGDEIVTAATLRVHGTKFAEMPFIATRDSYRCQGMCSKLMLSIESTLRLRGVENLVIPSIPQRVNKWNRCGFHPLQDGLKKEMKNFNSLMFPQAIKLQKLLLLNIPPATTGAADNFPNEASVQNEPRRRPLFDLNLMPAEEDEMNDHSGITYQNY
ncbi:increased DNA methylation 1-like isoform X2 [Malania oleifera]|uniref:increased DNA methylation 1-like isoform X2 n=1 Tax=Malania oleifera TaxID=397392 RepID=UPI0025AE5E73|nr:increased DNA methylation 1-like isoform X2 [Malania oleifera]XP_057976520.1 increased DNA methylation 1-like isoform X2 [Malania oleifera]